MRFWVGPPRPKSYASQGLSIVVVGIPVWRRCGQAQFRLAFLTGANFQPYSLTLYIYERSAVVKELKIPVSAGYAPWFDSVTARPDLATLIGHLELSPDSRAKALRPV